MKKKVKDFTIEIDDKYLVQHEMGKFRSEEKTLAIINIEALNPSVKLTDLADAIIGYTFPNHCNPNSICLSGIDRELFIDLKIILTINKDSDCKVEYTFEIPNYCSTDSILPAIASELTL